MENYHRYRSKATVFVVCAPLILEKIGSEIHTSQGVCCLPCFTVTFLLPWLFVYTTRGNARKRNAAQEGPEEAKHGRASWVLQQSSYAYNRGNSTHNTRILYTGL